MSKLLEVADIDCRYGDKVIIGSLSFALDEGQIACLLGPSGCGKTTALRAIAGLEPVYGGSVSLDGRALSDIQHLVPPEQRRIGMVFQDYALFPHMNVADNIAFGLQDQPKARRQETVTQLLALIQLEEYAQAYPHQLSGGQQQRVALARALAPEPRVLLLDEPFSNLDTELRRALSLEVRKILKARNTSAILVTHDQSEAFAMADVIGVMHKGALQQWDSARRLYHAPANQFVASFICHGRFLPGEITADGRVATVFGEQPLAESQRYPAATPVNVLIRPWELQYSDQGEGVEARVSQVQFHGASTVTSLSLDDGHLLESTDEHFVGMPNGEAVRLRLVSDGLLAFPATVA